MSPIQKGIGVTVILAVFLMLLPVRFDVDTRFLSVTVSAVN